MSLSGNIKIYIINILFAIHNLPSILTIFIFQNPKNFTTFCSFSFVLTKSSYNSFFPQKVIINVKNNFIIIFVFIVIVVIVLIVIVIVNVIDIILKNHLI